MVDRANAKDLAHTFLKPKDSKKEYSYIGQSEEINGGEGANSMLGADLKDEIRLRVNLES